MGIRPRPRECGRRPNILAEPVVKQPTAPASHTSLDLQSVPLATGGLSILPTIKTLVPIAIIRAHCELGLRLVPLRRRRTDFH